MRERLRALPRSLRIAGVLMLVVPTVLWLFLVWDTRPYSRAEIAADRIAVESSPSFAQAVEDCWSSSYPVSSWTGNGFKTTYPLAADCRKQVLEARSSLTREPLEKDDEWWDPATLAMLSMAAAVLLVGVTWQPAPGARPFLRRAGKILLLGAVATFVVDATWWWALGWIAERRGMSWGLPEQLISRGAALCGLCGVVGLATVPLLRGPVRAVATSAIAAVVIGVLVLVVHPVDPWLPMLNVEAFLFGSAEYDHSREVLCSSLYSYGVPGFTDVCTIRDATRSAGGAAGYLFGGATILAVAAALVHSRIPTPRRD